MAARPVVALLGTLLLAGAARAAGVPLTLTTSGYLLDAADHPLTQQGVSLRFSVWKDPESTSPANRAWPATESECLVDVKNGFYTAVFDGSLSAGCGAGLTSEFLPPGLERYLQVSVEGTTLTPRLRLGTVPNAAFATQSGDTQALIAALAASGTLNADGNPVDWSQLKNVPDSLTGGIIAAGTWQATPLADAYVASAAGWNARLASVNHDGSLAGAGTAGSALSVVYGTASGTAAAGDDARLSDARAPTAGSGLYLQNGASAQSASFNVTGNGAVGGTLSVTGDVTAGAKLDVAGDLAVTGNTSGDNPNLRAHLRCEIFHGAWNATTKVCTPGAVLTSGSFTYPTASAACTALPGGYHLCGNPEIFGHSTDLFSRGIGTIGWISCGRTDTPAVGAVKKIGISQDALDVNAHVCPAANACNFESQFVHCYRAETVALPVYCCRN